MIYNGMLGGCPIEITAINGVKKITYKDDGSLVDNQSHLIKEVNRLINGAYMQGESYIKMTDAHNNILLEIWL